MLTPKITMLNHHKIFKFFTLLICLNIIVFLSPLALADEGNWSPEPLHLHAFGTLGASYHDEKGLDYRRNVEQKNGVQTNQLDFTSDSLLGGQADLLINDELSSNLQLVSRNNSEGNWKPELITGFIKYKPSEKLQFRLGRMLIVSNLGAETRYAGYAFTAVRPSLSVFSAYDRYDGIDIEYTTPLANGIANVLVNYGKTVGEAYLGNRTIDIKNITNTGLTAGWQKNNFEVLGLFTVLNAKNQTAYEPLAQALETTPFPLANQRATEIRNSKEFKVYIYGASVKYEFDAWKIEGVLGRSHINNYSQAKAETGSMVLAYRSGEFTPYAIAAYSRIKTKSKPTGVPNLNAQLLALNTAYNTAINAYNTNQNTLSLGLRYDFAENYAIKTQIDKINAESNPAIISSRPQGDDKDLTLFTIALDFLF